MGFGTRLKLGLSTIFSSKTDNAYGSSKVRGPYNSMPLHQIQYMAGLGTQGGGFSQPVWGPEISTVGAYSREGYTSRTFDVPTIPFRAQSFALERDEDIQLAINHLSSQVTGGEHYWKSEFEEVSEHITQFSRDIDFDWIDTILVKELLAFGNSIWKPRLGIQNIRNRDDIMQIPISSFVRVWWDRMRRPYKYEFRGPEYQGYHNPEDILPFVWNPINASAFGTGFVTSMLAPRRFTEITPAGPVEKELPSLLDRKYSTAMTMHLTERRYIPHNVYVAHESSQPERDTLATDLADLETGEDFVVGNKVEVIELGSAQRAFNPTQFNDLTQGAIFKALNDFRGKQGSESSHQYANAKTSAILDEIGLASFPLAVTRQLVEKLFEPWYNATGGAYSAMYGGGMIAVPWKEANPELNFGRVQKRDLPPEQLHSLLQLAIQSGAVQDPLEIRDLLEDGGLGLRKEFTDQMNMQYNNYGAMPQEMGGYDWNTQQADQQGRPMDDPNYNSMAQSLEGLKSMDATLGEYPQNPQPSDPRINFTTGGAAASTSKKNFKKAFDELDIDDVNAWLANSGAAETIKEQIKLENEKRKVDLDDKKLKLEMRKKVIEMIHDLQKKAT